MAIPTEIFLVEMPATEGVKASVFLYERCNAFWCEPLSPDERELLGALIKRKQEADDDQS